jgi:hypothetical protein
MGGILYRLQLFLVVGGLLLVHGRQFDSKGCRPSCLVPTELSKLSCQSQSRLSFPVVTIETNRQMRNYEATLWIEGLVECFLADNYTRQFEPANFPTVRARQ